MAVNDIAGIAIFNSLKQITAKVNINVFSQILSLIDRDNFNFLVRKHDSDKHHKGINSWTHLVSMLFCHLSSADSVRDISNGLRSTTGNMRHMGISRVPSKSNLSYMNAHRDHKLFRDLYMWLLIRYGRSRRTCGANSGG